MPATTLPKVAVYKFSSCDGCQLGLLNLEDDLLALVGEVEVAYFLEARSQIVRGPYDVALVEGSITTAEDEERLQAVRQESKFLVTIGACATTGGIQALRNWADVKEFTRAVYATPDYIHTLDLSTPISTHVPVDFELNGCPINKLQLLDVITQLLVGRVPRVPMNTVCLDCKRRGTVCIMVAHGTPCLGRLLRLFRAPTRRKRGFIEPSTPERGYEASRSGAAASRLHRIRGRVPVRERQGRKGGVDS